MVWEAGVFAGGTGTRLAVEMKIKPKPLVKNGGALFFRHIEEICSKFPFEDFSNCRGGEGYLIKDCFSNDCPHMAGEKSDPAGISPALGHGAAADRCVHGFAGNRVHSQELWPGCATPWNVRQ
ncbi:hypothetical protein [Azospirillum brasilense]|uniref:hypothetical protein n=1 Tax=Azospirillum brasilense TaxID=192 RepID=UPI0011ED5627|nr:hypothetical protein [Azospirillum brasilense]